MHAAHKKRLFIDRTDHRPLLVDARNRSTGSYLGARPARGAIAGRPKCPRCGEGLLHQLTLSRDTLGAAIAGKRSITMLVCRDIGCRMASHDLVTPSAIVFVVHDDSQRAGKATAWDGPSEGRGLSLGPIAHDLDPETKLIRTISKLGGQPGYINNWGEQSRSTAEAAGRTLFLQWSEESYRNVKAGPMPFLFGVVYIFTRMDPTTKLPTLDDPVAFWQNT